MARDKYLMYLRQQEYKKRIIIKVDNTRIRMNREYMNQPEVDKETLEVWDSQPSIYFDLGGNNERIWNYVCSYSKLNDFSFCFK